MGLWNACKNSARNFKRNLKENWVQYFAGAVVLGTGVYFAVDRGLLDKKVRVELPEGYEIRKLESGNDDDEMTINEDDSVPFED